MKGLARPVEGEKCKYLTCRNASESLLEGSIVSGLRCCPERVGSLVQRRNALLLEGVWCGEYGSRQPWPGECLGEVRIHSCESA